MADFFGLADDTMPPGLSETDLLALYRQNLKRVCDLTYAADLAVPHPSRERTWFRLVIGGNHSKVLELFRDIESKVMGREAAAIRAQAKDHAVATRTKQLSLGGLGPPRDPWYRAQNSRDLDAARARTLDYVSTHGATRFGTLWPDLLQELHVTRAELARCVLDHVRAGALDIEPVEPRRRTVRDDDLLQPRPR